MADLMGSLNERQREAVLETEGYVRVIAGQRQDKAFGEPLCLSGSGLRD